MAQDIIIDYDAYSHRAEAQKFLNDLPHHIQNYFIGLFPIATWIHRYNLTVSCICYPLLSSYSELIRTFI